MLGVGSALATASAAPAPQIVTIDASSSKLFSPSHITVHAGAPVELKIVGEGGVHAIASSKLGIPNTMTTPGATKVVTFTPAKAGTYHLRCQIPCGPDHDSMMITVKVV